MKQNSNYDKNSDFYKKAFEEIHVSEKMKADLKNPKRLQAKKKDYHVVKIIGAAAAAVCIFFTGLVNGSTAFAASMENIPVIGRIAELVNFRSYSEETEDYKVSASIPAVVKEEDGTNGEDTAKGENNAKGEDNLTGEGIEADQEGAGEAVKKSSEERIADLNREIEKRCEQYTEEAKQRAEEYHQAFLETGGTEEEWKEHDIGITVDYEVKCENEKYLSFVVYGTENWVSAYATAYYYNLDSNTLQDVTLEDLFGPRYVELINEQIKTQMKERVAKGDESFFGPEMGGFESISDETNFYINEDGKVVITFEKYEIAPGYMGIVEFEIPIPQTN